MKKFLSVILLALLSITALSAADNKTEEGKATYYSKNCRSKTSSGEYLDPEKFTCAHRTHPFGTLLLVTNKKNDKSVVVRVNDRGPFGKGIIVDLSYGAAKELGMISDGIVDVTVEVLTEDAEEDSCIY